ncbi:MAG: carboxypeptidase-like regulatory domain-containing protein, partial [Bacteroidota bacterium]
MNDTISLRIALRCPMIGVLLLLCCPWSWTELNAQIARHTLSGYVRDAAGKEFLSGASLWVPEIQNGTSSNDYGFYSITLPSGTYRLQVSYVG